MLLVFILSKIYPVSSITTRLSQIHLLLSSHQRLGLPKDIFPSSFPTKNLCAFLDCSMRATCPGHLSRFLIMSGAEYNACSAELWNFLHSPVISPLLAPNIFQSCLFSNTLNLCSSLQVRNQISQPFNTTGSIIVLYIS